MLMIRLQRVGRKNSPHFRVVLTDKRNSTKSGKFLEILGSYSAREGKFAVNSERVKHWLSKGAQVSGTMNNFLVDHKILSGKKINVLSRKKPIVKEEAKEATAPISTPPAAPAAA